MQSLPNWLWLNVCHSLWNQSLKQILGYEKWNNVFCKPEVFQIETCTYYITLILIILAKYIETYVYSFKRQPFFPSAIIGPKFFGWHESLEKLHEIAIFQLKTEYPFVKLFLFQLPINESLKLVTMNLCTLSLAVILGPQLCVKNFFFVQLHSI